MNIVMTIAGSDSGGGAGIQADLKTFQELNVFGTSAITALTAQNTLGVHGIFPTTPEFVEQQMNAIFDDFSVKAVKTGMLFSADIIKTVGTNLKNRHLQIVVDPVMIAKGGASLLQKNAIDALQSFLLPYATVLTPNIPEAEVITGMTIQSKKELKEAAKTILNMGPKYVVMKGGHLDSDMSSDYVFSQEGLSFQMETKRIQTEHTHGTGCTFSAAITSFLARGFSLKEAIIEAKKFVHMAIANPLHIGHGHGPTNHFAYQRLHGNCEVHIIE